MTKKKKKKKLTLNKTTIKTLATHGRGKDAASGGLETHGSMDICCCPL